MDFNIESGLLISLPGTMFGSAFVFLMKDEMSVRVQKSLLDFAIGFVLMMVLDVVISVPLCKIFRFFSFLVE